MLNHLLKLIWKRKARNLMLSLEILIAFLIVFAIAAAGVRYAQIYRMPLGMVYADVWAVQLLPPVEVKATFTPALYARFRQDLEALLEVESVAFAGSSPFTNSGMNGNVKLAGSGRKVNTDMIEANDDFFEVLGMQEASGRFFDRSDDGATPQPVVVNRRLARELFGTEDAVGLRYVASDNFRGNPAGFQVRAVVDDLRYDGELSTPTNVMIMRHVPFQTGMAMPAMVLKMAPGTPRAFEEKLHQQLKLIRNDWGYEISPLAALRTSSHATAVAPLKIVAVIAAFLLAMVAVGLFGVLWQNTTRRIPEIGLRRALGATEGDIYRQIIAEQFLLSSGAIAAAMLLLVQLPITGALGEWLNWSVFGRASALSMAVIYLLSLLCSVYPGWRASRLHPSAALHYE